MNETTDATAIFAPIWRRKWLILAVALAVGAASYAYYKRQSPTYQATTQVFLGASAEEQAPSEKGSKKLGGTAVTNQAAVLAPVVDLQPGGSFRHERQVRPAARHSVIAP